MRLIAVARICGKFIVCAVTVNSGGTCLYFNSAPEHLHTDKNNAPVGVILNATACCLLFRVIMGPEMHKSLQLQHPLCSSNFNKSQMA